MMTLPAFLVAIALLIVVHEYGHFRVARACGVKVLRFSIGFGKPLWRRQADVHATEFVIALVPLGGFVRMLDEREAPVPPEQRHLAFNRQTLPRRAAIVAAGPLANLALAVVLYALVNWIGVQLPAPVVSLPAQHTLASQAGLGGGERVLSAGLDGQELEAVTSFEDVRWHLTRGVVQGEDVRLKVASDGMQREVVIRTSDLPASEVDAGLFEKVGIAGPLSRPLIGETMAGGAAAKAGLHDGDEVISVDGQPMVDGAQLRQFIRSSASDGIAKSQRWTIRRQGQLLELQVTPTVVTEAGHTMGRIGAYVGARPDMVLVRFGVVDGLWRGLLQTWDVSALTLRMMGKMLVGEASVRNISGPLSIADYAGKAAGMGLAQYLGFLALISVSLGVLNLLPVPVLDGGHLMYYLWEWVTGKPVPDRWMERLQQGGVAVLVVLMSIALFNDFSRLLG